MAEHFWTLDRDVHECWRMASDVDVRFYQRVGECRREQVDNGFRASRFRLPAIFPECQHFMSVREAQGWIEEVLR